MKRLGQHSNDALQQLFQAFGLGFRAVQTEERLRFRLAHLEVGPISCQIGRQPKLLARWLKPAIQYRIEEGRTFVEHLGNLLPRHVPPRQKAALPLDLGQHGGQANRQQEVPLRLLIAPLLQDPPKGCSELRCGRSNGTLHARNMAPRAGCQDHREERSYLPPCSCKRRAISVKPLRAAIWVGVTPVLFRALTSAPRAINNSTAARRPQDAAW